MAPRRRCAGAPAEELAGAIDAAVRAAVSAKYAKKVRRRLSGLLGPPAAAGADAGGAAGTAPGVAEGEEDGDPSGRWVEVDHSHRSSHSGDGGRGRAHAQPAPAPGPAAARPPGQQRPPQGPSRAARVCPKVPALPYPTLNPKTLTQPVCFAPGGTWRACNRARLEQSVFPCMTSSS